MMNSPFFLDQNATWCLTCSSFSNILVTLTILSLMLYQCDCGDTSHDMSPSVPKGTSTLPCKAMAHTHKLSIRIGNIQRRKRGQKLCDGLLKVSGPFCNIVIHSSLQPHIRIQPPASLLGKSEFQMYLRAARTRINPSYLLLPVPRPIAITQSSRDGRT